MAAGAGTLAELRYDKEGKPAGVKLIEVPTLASIQSASPNAGMFAEEELTFYKETEKRPFYFRPAGKAVWEKRFMPAPNCEHVKFPDDGGANLTTVCSDRAVGFGGPKFPYLSKDSGSTWQKR